MERVRAVGERLWVLGPSALALVGLDAALALPAWARAVLGAAFAVLGLRVLVGLVWPGRAARMTAMHAARVIEQRLGLRDNAIVNALQLRTALVSGDGLTAALAERAVDHGVEVAHRVEGTRVVDGRRAARSWGMVLASVAMVGASVLAMPRVWGAGALRYVDPFGNHAPWSPTVFDVRVSPREVLVGDDALVEVRLSGRIPESIDLVFLDRAGEPIDAAEMGAVLDRSRDVERGTSDDEDAPRRARRYELTLHDLREPVRFYPRGETGRGRIVEIDPLDKPRVVAAALVVRPPAYAGLPATTERVDLRPAGERRVLRGAEVELSVTGTVEIGRVERDGGTVTGEIDLLGTGAHQRVVADDVGAQTLAMRLVSRSGVPADDAVRVELRVVEDAPPRVWVDAPATPGERAAVLAGRAIPVEATAEDDVRVEGLDLSWRIVPLAGSGEGASREGTVALGVARPMRTRWEGALTLDSSALGVAPGDRIELWIEGRDGREEAFGGPQVTRVGPITVEVIDEAEFRRRSLERLGIDDVVGPYEDIAEAAGDLAELAREASEAARAASEGEATEAQAARAAEAVRGERDGLAREVRRRLGSEPLVDFDEEMRGALERLLERLEGFEEGPDASEGGEGGDGEAARAERNAERLDLAAREAQMDLEAPSERLRLAAQMRRELDRLDRIAKAQRVLADRLAGMDALGPEEGTRLAREQMELMAAMDRVGARLDALGDAAANELAGPEVLAGKELEVSRARGAAQEAIEDARRLADEPAATISDELLQDAMREAADLALTDLYFSTDPALDALDDLEQLAADGARRLDEPGVGETSEATREEIERALRAVEQIEALLEEARERARSFGIRKTAHARPPMPLGVALVAHLLGAIEQDAGGESLAVEPVEPESDLIEDRFVRALETARVRLGALKVRLREASEASGPRLPVMGQSAIDLARRVDDAEVAALMHDAEWALSEGDLARARERAALAAERLEALYERSGGDEAGQCAATEDTPLRLMDADPQQGQQGGQQSSGGPSGSSGGRSGASGSSGGASDAQGEGEADPSGAEAPGAVGGLPNALDALSDAAAGERSERARSGRRSGDESQAARPADDPTDRGGFARAGVLPGSAGDGDGRRGDDPGEPARDAQDGDAEGQRGSGSGAGGGDAGQARPREEGDPNLADRARRFNERLYADPVEIDRPVEGEGGAEGERIDADAIRLEGEPIGRDGRLRSLLARSGMDAAEVEAVFERVPPAYRDTVAAYLMRIARDDARKGDGEEAEDR